MPRFIPKHVKRRETNNVSLVMHPAPRLERLEKCSSCKFHDKAPDGRTYECRFYPPTGMLVPTGPQGQAVPVSFFPIVAPDWYCHQWKHRIETGKPS